MAVRNIFASLSSFQRVLLGLLLGIFTGLFFGEAAASLDLLGKTYIRLLQMTVLPYILVSLVVGLGRLGVAEAQKVGIVGLTLILMLWGITLISVLFLPFAYPDWTTSSFFSTSMVETPPPFDPLLLYVPSNPFYSMANSMVPAVVVFGILLGSTIIALPNKEHLLQSLSVLGDALMKIASLVAKVAPIGIFAISANAAGTLQLEELSRLQVFLWSYCCVWIVLAYWILPMVVAWSTPFSYKEVIKAVQEPMITALAAGTVLVVVPMIAERCKEMVVEKGLMGEQSESMIDLLAPTCYSFPSVGTLLGLGFILFGAWYMGSPLGYGDYLPFVGIGAFVAFGSMPVAIPFMLDFFALPTDLFQLYLLGSVITARLATALAAVHGVVICLLGAAAIAGKFEYKKVGQGIAVGLVMVALATALLGQTLTRAIDYEYTGEDEFERRGLLTEPVEAKVIDSSDAPAITDKDSKRLDVIRSRGSLRVGYMPDRLPFAHRNADGRVVGLDIELAHILARDLGISLEFIRAEWEDAVNMLNSGQLDVLVGGLSVTPDRALQVAFTHAYINQTVGLMVHDHRREEFDSLDKIREMQVRIAVPGSPYYIETLKRVLPNAEIQVIESPRNFLTNPKADALAFTLEAGSAWSLIYPEFTALRPRGIELMAPGALALPQVETEFVAYVNTWLDLKEANGQIKRLQRYWLSGEDMKDRVPRWSIMRDVLGLGGIDADEE